MNFLTELLMTVVDMSLKSIIVIIHIGIFRVGMRLPHAPRKWAYILWIAVALRLICPSFPELDPDESIFKYYQYFELMPDSFTENWGNTYTGDIQIIYEGQDGYEQAVTAGNPPVGAYENNRYVITDTDGISPPKTVKNTIFPYITCIWLGGIGVMLLWNLGSMLRLRRRLREAVQLEDNIYIADHLETAFVTGLLRPKIYLPSGLSPTEQSCIIAHERIHIRHCDHWIKLFAFALLTIHWFNPFVWLAYHLTMRDMEATCDEFVFADMDENARSEYAHILLKLSTGHKSGFNSPLAFGESNISARIKHIFAYQPETKWALAGVIIIYLYTCGNFLTDPVRAYEPYLQPSIYYGEEVIYAAEENPADIDYCITTIVEQMESTGEFYYPLRYHHIYMTDRGGGWQHLNGAEAFRISNKELAMMLPEHSVQIDPLADGYIAAWQEETGEHRFCLLLCTETDQYYGAVGTSKTDNYTPEDMTIEHFSRLQPDLAKSQFDGSFYEISLENLLSRNVELLMPPELAKDESSDLILYAIVCFRCDGSTKLSDAGTAVFRIEDNHFAEYTNYLYIYEDAAINSSITFSTYPVTANETGTLTAESTHDIILISDPAVTRAEISASTGTATYTKPDTAEDCWYIVVPWDQTGGGANRSARFYDQTGALVYERDGWNLIPDAEQMVLNHRTELTKYALDCISTPRLTLDAEQYPEGIIRVKRTLPLGTGVVVEMYMTSDEAQETGIYYSETDQPAVVPVKDSFSLIDNHDGTWSWQASDGSYGTTKRITNNWFSFEAYTG